MSKQSHKVLVLGTSKKTRGGITSVIKAHNDGVQWDRYQCRWIETHIDSNVFLKLLYFVNSLMLYSVLLPFYNLVHIHTSEPPSAFRKIIFVALAKLLRKKVIIHFHSFSPETTIRGKHQWIYKYLFSRSDLIIVLSQYWEIELNRKYHFKNKVKVLYNPCISPDAIIKYSTKKNILYAGTLNSRKGYKDLIKAFSLIASKFPEWKIVFAGNGEIEEAKSIAEELRIIDQILFLGWVNGDEKDKAFQEASIFCLPSYAEGFPMAVLDAWAYGIPVITTPVGGLPDILVNEINALVFDPGDIKSLASKIELMICDNKLRDNIKKESLNFSKNIFNKNQINKELENFYELLLSN